ncbi:MAG TPA: hypothetical protein VE224_14305 [Pseudolabrys sp.]|nr:hypothetical protein [Pseudolabrys sp.]
MSLRRALFIAAIMLPAGVAPAAAQFAPGAQQEPPCMKSFAALRDDAAKKAQAIRAANDHHADAKTACHLFGAFVTAEEKLIKYADANATWCGIPAQVIKQMKQAHVKTSQIRVKICQAAAAPPRPRAPTLSDTLGAPVPDARNIKPGRGGTFDTLTGSPLGSR